MRRGRENPYPLWPLILGMVVWSGCNPAPHYRVPAAAAPPAYKEATPEQFKEGAGWKLADPADDRIRANWWEMYGDSQLNKLEEEVEISNQTIAAAEANFQAARAVVVTARSALFPTVSTSPSYTASKFSATSRTGSLQVPNANTGTSAGLTGGASSIINNFSLPIDVTYTVDLWHKVRNTVAANAATAEASAADVATALLSTQAEVAQDYFQVRALDQERSILEETLADYRQALALTTSLYSAGLDSEQDVAQARTQLDTATAQATDLGVARAQYEHAIATLTGRPASEFSLAAGSFAPNPPEVPVAVPSRILERRPDIASAERKVAAANSQIGVARAAYYPNLTLGASGGLQTADIAQWFSWPSRFWSLGPSLAETLFDAGARRGTTDQARAAFDAAVANYRQTVLTDFQSVEDNLAALRILAQEVGEQHTAVGSAQHSLDLALTRYQAGIDSYLNVITAQTTLLNNRETEVQIQLRQLTASAGLILALGGGWDKGELPNIKQLLVEPAKTP